MIQHRHNLPHPSFLPIEQWSSEQVAKCGWTLEQITAWSRGSWTPEKIIVLEQREDEHIDNCDECQERLKIDPSTLPENENYYCPIGESLAEDASQASVEYSWQLNFDPEAYIRLRKKYLNGK